jgi:heptosyltransferase-3
MEELVCLIAGRNLGDIVMQGDVFKRLALRGFARAYMVWTRPQAAFLFADMPDWRIVTSQFPIGTNKQFSVAAAFGFWRAARVIRGFRPSATLDLVGDFRERSIARLVGAKRHIHIGWAREHPINRLHRNPIGVGQPEMVVPADVHNVYAAYDLFVEHLAPALKHAPANQLPPEKPPKSQRVGLHPFASQECRLWPKSSWQELAHRLVSQGVEVIAFGAVPDGPALKELFTDDTVTLSIGSLASFGAQLATVDVLVGLDSLSVHMAQHVGVRSVMINGANNHQIWAPPNSRVLAKSGGCQTYPCYNKPRCRGTRGEYACIRSITVEEVLSATLAGQLHSTALATRL